MHLRRWTGPLLVVTESCAAANPDYTGKLRGRSIVRAFEVEHTTSVYSGILRMADLLALQPNMDIKLHIVAPLAKREKVFSEIRRPVFSLLEREPLAESCTYISYDSLGEVASHKHLAFFVRQSA